MHGTHTHAGLARRLMPVTPARSVLQSCDACGLWHESVWSHATCSLAMLCWCNRKPVSSRPEVRAMLCWCDRKQVSRRPQLCVCVRGADRSTAKPRGHHAQHAPAHRTAAVCLCAITCAACRAEHVAPPHAPRCRPSAGPTPALAAVVEDTHLAERHPPVSTGLPVSALVHDPVIAGSEAQPDGALRQTRVRAEQACSGTRVAGAGCTAPDGPPQEGGSGRHSVRQAQDDLVAAVALSDNMLDIDAINSEDLLNMMDSCDAVRTATTASTCPLRFTPVFT